MRTKSRYRENKSENNIPVENKSPVEAVIAPEGPAVAVESQPQAEPPKPQAADEPALALSKQLEALKQSEEIQRQQAARIAASQQQPVTREQKLDLWRRQGLSDAEASFLQQHPDMIDHPQIANAAAAEAMQAGHKRDSEEYWKATKMNFDNHLNRLGAPKFFQAPPPPAPPTRSTNIVSAPVSRSVPSGGPRPENPNRMTLSPEEVEIAKASGISAAQYAQGKIRLQKEKASGERQ